MMKAALKTLSYVLLAAASLVIFSCNHPDIYECPGNFRVGRIGNSREMIGAYLVASWDLMAGAESYNVYTRSSSSSKEVSVFALDISDNYCVKLLTSSNVISYQFLVEGVSSLGTSLVVSATPAEWYGEFSYDILDAKLSWTKYPMEGSQYILVKATSANALSDTFTSLPASSDAYSVVRYSENYDTMFASEIDTSGYYAVYVLEEMVATYLRMTAWTSGSDLLSVGEIYVSGYTTGANSRFDIYWNKVDWASSYTVLASIGDEFTELDTVSLPPATVSLNDLGWTGSGVNLSMKVRVNASASYGVEFCTSTLSLPLPKGMKEYASSCVISEEMDNQLFVFRKGSTAFDAVWTDGNSYYLSAYRNGSSSSMQTWKNKGLKTSPYSISSYVYNMAATREQNETNKLKFFLHTENDYSGRASNYVEVTLQ